MADHDDQISSNRRRLFKALSAAPVVMTLRPGVAAATSAYQCVAKITEQNPLVYKECPGDVCVSDPDGFIYEEHWFFDPSDGTPKPNSNNPRLCPPATTSSIIVEINDSYFNLMGDDVTDFVLRSSGTPPFLDIYQTADQSPSELCLSGIPGHKGIFAVVVQPINDNFQTVPADQATGAKVVGIYPQTKFDTPNQMMTGTCWTSISPGADLSGWILSRG